MELREAAGAFLRHEKTTPSYWDDDYARCYRRLQAAYESSASQEDKASEPELVEEEVEMSSQHTLLAATDEFDCDLEVVEVEGQGFVVFYNRARMFLVPPKEDEHDGQIKVKNVTIDL